MRYPWFSSETLLMMIDVSESTPSPIGVNMATYVGSHMFGWSGAIGASLALVFSSVVIIEIAKALHQFKENPCVRAAFKEIRPDTVP